jgi:hypothetical protein
MEGSFMSFVHCFITRTWKKGLALLGGSINVCQMNEANAWEKGQIQN